LALDGEEEKMASTTTTGVSTNAPGEMTSKPLIESDRVEGTAVYDPTENHIGSIKRLMNTKTISNQALRPAETDKQTQTFTPTSMETSRARLAEDERTRQD